MPRRTLPRDSSMVLPCSVVTVRASSSKCCSSRLHEPEHRPRALDHRRVAPGGEGLRRRGDGGVEIGARRQRRLRDHLAERRVVHVDELGRLGRTPSARRRSSGGSQRLRRGTYRFRWSPGWSWEAPELVIIVPHLAGRHVCGLTVAQVSMRGFRLQPDDRAASLICAGVQPRARSSRMPVSPSDLLSF